MIDGVARVELVPSGRAVAFGAESVDNRRIVEAVLAARNASAPYLAHAIGQIWVGQTAALNGRAAAAYAQADAIPGPAITVDLPSARLSV